MHGLLHFLRLERLSERAESSQAIDEMAIADGVESKWYLRDQRLRGYLTFNLTSKRADNCVDLLKATRGSDRNSTDRRKKNTSFSKKSGF
jgi:hypothetical protein